MRLPDFILANIEPILVEWEAFARSIWPAAAPNPAELRDDAEAILRTTAADVTAYAHQDDAQHALRAGFQVHVPKPVDAHELTSVIARLARPS